MGGRTEIDENAIGMGFFTKGEGERDSSMRISIIPLGLLGLQPNGGLSEEELQGDDRRIELV